MGIVSLGSMQQNECSSHDYPRGPLERLVKVWLVSSLSGLEETDYEMEQGSNLGGFSLFDGYRQDAVDFAGKGYQTLFTACVLKG